jgi:hypothetical protein
MGLKSDNVRPKKQKEDSWKHERVSGCLLYGLLVIRNYGTCSDGPSTGRVNSMTSPPSG